MFIGKFSINYLIIFLNYSTSYSEGDKIMEQKDTF